MMDDTGVVDRYVESERNLADRLTKGLSATVTVRGQLDQELDRIRLDLVKLDIIE